MTLATLFLAQAVGADLSVGQYVTIIAVAMLTSKGASGVTGGGLHHARRHSRSHPEQRRCRSPP